MTFTELELRQIRQCIANKIIQYNHNAPASDPYKKLHDKVSAYLADVEATRHMNEGMSDVKSTLHHV